MISAAELKTAILADEVICRRIAFDTLADILYVDGRMVSDAARAHLLIDLQDRLHLHVNNRTLSEVLYALEHESQFRFNPLTAYLDSVGQWDGELRLTTLFASHFTSGMDATYLEAVAKNFFTSLVARAYEPGCKVDTMLILEGMQGIGKSRALRVIGGPWYREHKAEKIGGKDMLQAMKGSWLYDINELRGFASTDRRTIKSLLSSQEDVFRLPYRRDAICHKRTGVIVGSTNDNLYLNDETGARRFWPVACGYKVEVELIERDRDQLFAEAIVRYRSGEDWWTMPDDLQAEIALARSFISPYFESVSQFIGNSLWLPRYASGENPRWHLDLVFAYVRCAELAVSVGMNPHWNMRDRQSRELDHCMRALGFERIPVRLVKLDPESLSPDIRVPIYRKYMGMVGTVSLLPEEKPSEPPLIRLVPKPGQESIEGVA